MQSTAARSSYTDFGTATTFCAISEKAEYIGGTIAPGLKISSEALFEKTAKLPKVELEEPGHVICRNTINSMQSGLVYGHMGMVDYIVKKMKKELQEYSKDDSIEVKVIATGGLADDDRFRDRLHRSCGQDAYSGGS